MAMSVRNTEVLASNFSRRPVLLFPFKHNKCWDKPHITWAKYWRILRSEVS